MLLHEVVSLSGKAKRPRVGRGGKRGTTSGRGQKGQGAHAGRRVRPAERDLIRRLPKLRGRGIHAHKPLRPKLPVINIKDLDALAVIPRGVKILGSGTMKKAFIVQGTAISKSARAKIEKAGGSIKL